MLPSWGARRTRAVKFLGEEMRESGERLLAGRRRLSPVRGTYYMKENDILVKLLAAWEKTPKDSPERLQAAKKIIEALYREK